VERGEVLWRLQDLVEYQPFEPYCRRSTRHDGRRAAELADENEIAAI
jgi:hypothetical protein